MTPSLVEVTRIVEMYVKMLHWLKKSVAIYTSQHQSDDVSLDLSYITDRIIVCACPTTKTHKMVYRNSLYDLLRFLENKHGDHWRIWNLREEWRGDYDVGDISLRDKMCYEPWPDHQPPDFAKLVSIIGAIGEFLYDDPLNVAVIHCKHGKGRSGLIAIGVLMMKFGYPMEVADALFTERRMRSGFGSGLSISCQRRYAEYLDLSKRIPYTERKITIRLTKIRLIHARFDSQDLQVELVISGLTRKDETATMVSFKTFQPEEKNLLVNGTSKPFPADLKIAIARSYLHGSVSSSWAYMCLNMYWEAIELCGKFQRGVPMVTQCRWDDMDGFKGTTKKGFQLFDTLELCWVAD